MTTRIEKIGNATLYLGDCMDILPTLEKVDAVITDPPYGIGVGLVKNNKSGKYGIQTGKLHNSLDWDVERPKKIIFDLILEKSNVSIIWGGNYFADLLPAGRGWLVWDKMNDAFITTSNGELAWSNINSPLKFFRRPHALDKGFQVKDGFANVHPTQKPLPLMRFCLDFAKNSKTILDPFMGSGTTGVACAQLGRSFIGIEREPAYFDIACRRIEQAYKQGQLFEHEPIKQIQGDLL